MGNDKPDRWARAARAALERLLEDWFEEETALASPPAHILFPTRFVSVGSFFSEESMHHETHGNRGRELDEHGLEELLWQLTDDEPDWLVKCSVFGGPGSSNARRQERRLLLVAGRDEERPNTHPRDGDR
jgi:hypothetical protein